MATQHLHSHTLNFRLWRFHRKSLLRNVSLSPPLILSLGPQSSENYIFQTKRFFFKSVEFLWGFSVVFHFHKEFWFAGQVSISYQVTEIIILFPPFCHCELHLGCAYDTNITGIQCSFPEVLERHGEKRVKSFLCQFTVT